LEEAVDLLYDRLLMNEFREAWVPVTIAWCVLRLQMEEQPPDMDGSCEYLEQAVMDSQQGVVLQSGGWVRC
jgi:hypothetical protein